MSHRSIILSLTLSVLSMEPDTWIPDSNPGRSSLIYRQWVTQYNSGSKVPDCSFLLTDIPATVATTTPVCAALWSVLLGLVVQEEEVVRLTGSSCNQVRRL